MERQKYFGEETTIFKDPWYGYRFRVCSKDFYVAKSVLERVSGIEKASEKAKKAIPILCWLINRLDIEVAEHKVVVLH